jgi:D-alanyl-D-alanine dipeptidase
MDGDFVFVDELVPGLRWDAKYATWDNFTGRPVDGYLTNRIVGTKALCAALEKARGKAESLGFGLLPAAARCRLLSPVVQTARRRPDEATALSEYRQSRDNRKWIRGHQVESQSGQHR